MKSLAELAAIKEQVKNKLTLREGTGDKRILVGLATCGIAAGARPIMDALTEAVAKADFGSDIVTVSQTGCIGLCQYEPIVEVYEAGKEKTTYVKVTPAMVDRIMEEHIKGGNPVGEYTISAYKK